MNIDFKYVDFNEIQDTDQMPSSFMDMMDRAAWEKLFHSLPQDQLEVLVCLFLGMKPMEIVETLQYQNVQRFYNVNVHLKKSYREQKALILGYN